MWKVTSKENNRDEQSSNECVLLSEHLTCVTILLLQLVLYLILMISYNSVNTNVCLSCQEKSKKLNSRKLLRL